MDEMLINNHNLINNCDDLELMKEQGKINQDEYLDCLMALSEDMMIRLSLNNHTVNGFRNFYQQKTNLLGDFITSKGLQDEFDLYFNENNQQLSINYVNLCVAIIKNCDYLKSKGESLTKLQLDDYILAKDVIQNIQV